MSEQLPDLPDVDPDNPRSPDEDDVNRPEKEPNNHPTGEQQAQENAERELPA